MNDTTRTESEFERRFRPLTKDGEGELFSYEEVKYHNLYRVWTVVESDDGKHQIACPGFHTVNVNGYLKSEFPWRTGDEQGYWYYDDRTEYIIIGRYDGGEDEVFVMPSDSVEMAKTDVILQLTQNAREDYADEEREIYLDYVMSAKDNQIIFHNT